MQRKIVIVLILLISIVGITQAKGKKKKKEQQATGLTPQNDENYYQYLHAPMPPIRTVLADRSVITNKELKGSGNTMLMIFNPTCSHCEEMAMRFEQNIFLFKKTKILLIAASTMFEHLEYFSNNTRLTNFPSIKYGVDSSNALNALFNRVALPQINFYNEEHKLIKTFNGEIPIDSLKPYIN